MVETHKIFVVNIYTIMVKLLVPIILFSALFDYIQIAVNEIINDTVLYSSLVIAVNYETYKTIGQ